MAERTAKQRPARLQLPESISLTAVHPWGPWAKLARNRVRLAPLECSIRNASPEPLAVSDCRLEPLRDAANGGSAAASLSLKPMDNDLWPLDPGQTGSLWIGGEGQLAPGRYSSQLTLATGEGQSAASVPVNLTVRANGLWAAGFVVLGLAFLGLLLHLAERATLNEHLAEALTEQRQLHELLESSR